MSGIKIDARDRWFSLLVRERAGNRCEACGDNETVQCAHIQGRRHRATRWHPWNAICLDYKCHRFYTEHPLEFSLFLQQEHKIFTARQLDDVIALSHSTPRYRKAELEEIRLNLKASYEKMMMERRAGVTGRIEFDSPYPESKAV